MRYSLQDWEGGFAPLSSRSDLLCESFSKLTSFLKKKAHLESEYAKSLNKLCKGSEVGFLEKLEDVFSWKPIVEAVENQASMHTQRASDILEHFVEPIIIFSKQKEQLFSKLKSVELEHLKLLKEISASHEKVKKKFFKLYNAHAELQKMIDKGNISLEEKNKLRRKAVPVRTDRDSAEMAYRRVVREGNEALGVWHNITESQLLDEYQRFDVESVHLLSSLGTEFLRAEMDSNEDLRQRHLTSKHEMRGKNLQRVLLSGAKYSLENVATERHIDPYVFALPTDEGDLSTPATPAAPTAPLSQLALLGLPLGNLSQLFSQFVYNVPKLETVITRLCEEPSPDGVSLDHVAEEEEGKKAELTGGVVGEEGGQAAGLSGVETPTPGSLEWKKRRITADIVEIALLCGVYGVDPLKAFSARASSDRAPTPAAPPKLPAPHDINIDDTVEEDGPCTPASAAAEEGQILCPLSFIETFKGSDILSWIVTYFHCSSEAGITIGQYLLDTHILTTTTTDQTHEFHVDGDYRLGMDDLVHPGSVHTGILYKRGPSSHHKYLPRLFILRGHVLYYRAETESLYRGLILLNDFTLPAAETYPCLKAGQYSFTIETPRRLFHLYAPSEEQRQQWLSVLQAIAPQACLFERSKQRVRVGVEQSSIATKIYHTIRFSQLPPQRRIDILTEEQEAIVTVLEKRRRVLKAARGMTLTLTDPPATTGGAQTDSGYSEMQHMEAQVQASEEELAVVATLLREAREDLNQQRAPEEQTAETAKPGAAAAGGDGSGGKANTEEEKTAVVPAEVMKAKEEVKEEVEQEIKEETKKEERVKEEVKENEEEVEVEVKEKEEKVEQEATKEGKKTEEEMEEEVKRKIEEVKENGEEVEEEVKEKEEEVEEEVKEKEEKVEQEAKEGKKTEEEMEEEVKEKKEEVEEREEEVKETEEMEEKEVKEKEEEVEEEVKETEEMEEKEVKEKEEEIEEEVKETEEEVEEGVNEKEEEVEEEEKEKEKEAKEKEEEVEEEVEEKEEEVKEKEKVEEEEVEEKEEEVEEKDEEVEEEVKEKEKVEEVEEKEKVEEVEQKEEKMKEKEEAVKEEEELKE